LCKTPAREKFSGFAALFLKREIIFLPLEKQRHEEKDKPILNKFNKINKIKIFLKFGRLCDFIVTEFGGLGLTKRLAQIEILFYLVEVPINPEFQPSKPYKSFASIFL